MRSDPTECAGGSATHGYRTARGTGRFRRVVQGLVAVAGVAGLLVAPTPGWRVATITVAVAVAWMVRPAPDSARWLRGAAGEQATAALLERLPARRWVVLHDRALPGTRANIDHLAIGPSGVWLVDSKAYRAPLKGRWRAVYAGDRLIDPSVAEWEASEVAERLGVEVRPVLAIHGRGLATRGRRVGGVRIIRAGALVGRLRRRRGSAHLRRRDVAALGVTADRLFYPASGRRDRSRPRVAPGRAGR